MDSEGYASKVGLYPDMFTSGLRLPFCCSLLRFTPKNFDVRSGLRLDRYAFSCLKALSHSSSQFRVFCSRQKNGRHLSNDLNTNWFSAIILLTNYYTSFRLHVISIPLTLIFLGWPWFLASKLLNLGTCSIQHRRHIWPGWASSYIFVTQRILLASLPGGPPLCS